MIAGTVLLTIFIPKIYFSSTLYAKKKLTENQVSSIQEEDTNDNISVFMDAENSSISIESQLKQSHQDLKGFAIFKNLNIFFKQKIFLFSSMALASLFFIITVIQFWGPDYIKNVLKVENEDEITFTFAIVCISSPTLGVLFGGFVSSKAGGYEVRRAILVVLIFSLCAALSSIAVPLVSSLYPFIISMWIFLFFGGAILPGITGVIISSLPLEYRGAANSLTFFSSNLFGFLPAPTVYGFINDSLKTTYPPFAMMFCSYYSIVGVILISIATYFKYKSTPSIHSNISDHTEESSQITANFLESRKLPSKRNSVLGKNLAKVFTSYLEIDAGDQDEPELDKHHINHKKISQKQTNSNCTISEDNDTHHHLSVSDFNTKNNYQAISIKSHKNSSGSNLDFITTPHFNLIDQYECSAAASEKANLHSTEDDFLGHKHNQYRCATSNLEGKEESIFGPHYNGISNLDKETIEPNMYSNYLQGQSSGI